MNGEFLELYNKLSKDFAVFEASQKERWKSHNERAEDRKQNNDKGLHIINSNIVELSDSLDRLPCAANSSKMTSLEDSISVIKNNDLKHLQESVKIVTSRITVLVFTIIGTVAAAIIVLGVKVLLKV